MKYCSTDKKNGEREEEMDKERWIKRRREMEKEWKRDGDR